MADDSDEEEDAPAPFVCEQCLMPYKIRAQHLRWCRGHPPLVVRPPTPENTLPQGPDVSGMIIVDQLKANMAEDLSDMRNQRGFDEEDIKLVKERIGQRVKELVDAAPYLLREYLRDDVPREQVLKALELDLFGGLSTAAQELKLAQKDVPLLKPRVVDLKPNGQAKVVSFRMAELLLRMLKENPTFRKRVLQKSDEWKTGAKWKTRPTDRLKDIDDGVYARWHPHLLRPATEEEAYDVRVGLISNGDDIEVRHGRQPLSRS